MNKRIIGFDTLMSNTEVGLGGFVTTFKPLPNSNLVGTESADLILGQSMTMSNISAAQYKELLEGRAYLEFWIEAIDHSKPTANNRLYGKEEFRLGMDKVLHKVIASGGMQPGEIEHPPVGVYEKTKETQDAYFKRIACRLMRVDPRFTSHYIVDTKQEDESTFFLIRTNPSNPVIVKDIMLGKIPTFSIRTLGDFPLINGVNVGRNLLVITADYVYNPANKTSRALKSNFKFVDPKTATKIDVDIQTKVGNESVNLLNLMGLENCVELMVGVESDNSITITAIEKDVTKTYGELSSEIFCSIF